MSCSSTVIDFDNIIAMDCEMVEGEGKPNMIARVSVVNWYGNCLYDKFVKPTRKVIDYRTAISGIQQKHLAKGMQFQQVHRDVANILKNRLLVGHTIDNDLRSLGCCHPNCNIRDVSIYQRYQRSTPPHRQSLQFLAKQYLGIDIQNGAHDSVVDARASMWLYQQVAKEWEESLEDDEEEEEEEIEEEEEEYYDHNRYYDSSSSSDY